MEKIKKWKVNLKNEVLSEESTGILANSMDIARCMDGINEVVDWIKKHERIMVKDRDWALAKLGEIEDRKSAATEK